jgi:hypothetical protein
VDVDADAVTGALDLDVGDAGALEAGGQQLADRDVFLDVVGVLLVGVPPGLPVGGDAEPEAVGLIFWPTTRASLLRRPSCCPGRGGGSRADALACSFRSAGSPRSR